MEDRHTEPLAPADPVVSPADTIRAALEALESFRAELSEYYDPSEHAENIAALDALLAVGERDKADAGTAAGRMRAVWAWIHEEGKGREDVLAELCPGWSIVSSRVAVEEALMVAFDRLVEERGERDRQHIAQLTEVGKAAQIVADLNGEMRSTYGRTVPYSEWRNALYRLETAVVGARAVLAGEEDAANG